MSRFFMNVLTRWSTDHEATRAQQLRDWSSARDSQLFRYTLIPRGHGRVDPWELAGEVVGSGVVSTPVIAVSVPEMNQELWARLLAWRTRALPHFIRENCAPSVFRETIERLLRSPGVPDDPLCFYASSDSLQLPAHLTERAHRLRLLGPKGHSCLGPHGSALGICARPTDAEAQAALFRHFPRDRARELAFALRLGAEDSWDQWAKAHVNMSCAPGITLYPMAQGQAPVPYVVGSYQTVARILAQLEATFFMIDFAPGELHHVRRCLELLGPR